MTNKWEISFDGWYPYCPVCKQEPKYRTPICMNCGTLLTSDPKDMEQLRQNDPEYYKEVMVEYTRKVLNRC